MGCGEDGQRNLSSLEIGGAAVLHWVSWDECVVSLGSEGWGEFSRSEQSRSGVTRTGAAGEVACPLSDS